MRLAVARRNECLDAIAPEANSGILRIYDGTRPANADTAISGNTVLAELTLNSTAFGAASGGVITANAITGDTSANATGTASWARIWQSNGTTPWGDLSVGVGSGELQLSTLSIVATVAVNVTSLTVTFPVGS